MGSQIESGRVEKNGRQGTSEQPYRARKSRKGGGKALEGSQIEMARLVK